MVENPSSGLVVVAAEVAVTVTREEHHQQVLGRYPVAPGGQRRVVVELGWCAIAAGKYRGEQAVEVRLDGQRVGELTWLMSQRYGDLVSGLLGQGARPGCEATVTRGARGLEIVLHLPRDPSAVPMPPVAPAPSPTIAWTPPIPAQRQNTFAAHKPAWIAGGVLGAIFLIVVAANSGTPTTPTAADSSTTTTTTTTKTTTTTTAPPTTTTTTTTTVAPAPPPVTQPPAPAPTTREVTQAPPPPPPAPAQECHPSYTPCVPIASDVDCEGGSGDGPAYVRGPIQVIGPDVYRLDGNDKDGIGCE